MLNPKVGLAAVALALAVWGVPKAADAQTATTLKVRVINPCPWGGPSSSDIAEWTALEPTIAAVQQYVHGPGAPASATVPMGTKTPDPFGRVGVSSVDSSRVVILEVVGGEDAQRFHADQLQTRVPLPNRLVICGVALSASRYRAITNDLYLGPIGRDPQFYGADRMSDGRPLIRLSGGAVQLAKTLANKYGPEVGIALGRLMWPAATPAPDAPPCHTIKPGGGPKLQWKLPKSLRVRTGTPLLFTGSVTNIGTTAIQTPGFVAVATVRGKSAVVADRAQSLSWTLELSYLIPKQAQTVRAMVGTDPCRPSDGYSLKPGKYDVYLLDQRSGTGAISPPIPLTVTP